MHPIKLCFWKVNPLGFGGVFNRKTLPIQVWLCLFVSGIFSFSSSFYKPQTVSLLTNVHVNIFMRKVHWLQLLQHFQDIQPCWPRHWELSWCQCCHIHEFFIHPTFIPHSRCLFGVWDPSQFCCTFPPGAEQCEAQKCSQGHQGLWTNGWGALFISEQECKFV